MLWRNWTKGCLTNLGKKQLFMEKYAGRETLELNLADKGQVCSHLKKEISSRERSESEELWQLWGLFVKGQKRGDCGWNLAIIEKIEGWSQRSSQEPTQVRSSDPRKRVGIAYVTQEGTGAGRRMVMWSDLLFQRSVWLFTDQHRLRGAGRETWDRAGRLAEN